jgi:hypothetical protein
MIALWAVCLGQAGRGVDPQPPTVKGNISIQLPRGWPTAAAAKATVVAVAPQPDKDATGQFQATFSVSQPLEGLINPVALQQSLAKENATYRPVEQPALRVINGMQVAVFGGTFTNNNTQLRTRFYYFAISNQLYISITFTCLASKWEAYQPIVEASVATFGVKK